jgi:hypothetical protein
MAIPLIEEGKHQVHLLASKHASFSETYETFGHWFHVGNLEKLIKLHAKDTDVFHVHNEPNWFVTLIKETCDVPVVLDVHDSFLARTTHEEAQIPLEDGTMPIRVTSEERNNFALADALVFPGESFRNMILEEYELTQPNIVLRSHVPRRLYRYTMQDWYGGLVYEGKVQLDVTDRLGRIFKYCDYREMAEACFKEQIPFHLYGARDDKPFLDVYDKNAIVHQPEVFDVLMRKLAAHDWGLVGNIFKTSEWDYAMPNKLFEYVAACVPVVAMNAKECEEYVVEKGIGIAVKSLGELKERWDEHKSIRNSLIKNRAKLSMEENIQPLKDLYELVAK